MRNLVCYKCLHGARERIVFECRLTRNHRETANFIRWQRDGALEALRLIAADFSLVTLAARTEPVSVSDF